MANFSVNSLYLLAVYRRTPNEVVTVQPLVQSRHEFCSPPLDAGAGDEQLHEVSGLPYDVFHM